MSNQPTTPPQLGREYITLDEDPIIEGMVDEMRQQMNRIYKDKPMQRQVHTKMHGCVKGKFVIEPGLSEDLRVGVFKDAKTYHCFVRFSNSQTIPRPDAKKDIRGIAIKLLNVPGEKALRDKKDGLVQDFLLMSSETFFSKNIGEFQHALKAFTAKNKAALFLYFIKPWHWSLFRRLIKSMVKCDNPLSMSYWSTQPFRFGSENRAVKYYLKPSEENRIINENLKEAEYLRINLGQTLASNAAKFDFFVQFQTDAITMPIEDPTVAWGSDYIKVATLEIPSQEFDTTAQMRHGQNLSFNSWHSLVAHAPLGSFNRARKRAYVVMSELRHKANGQEDKDPEDSADFLENTSWPVNPDIGFKIPKKGLLTLVAQTTINCSKREAFEFISSNDELPNWLKKSGMVHAALNAEVLTGTYLNVGARRRVYFDGGNSVLEELLTYNPHANYSYKISEFTNIISRFSTHAYGQFWFDREDDKTRVTWEYSFSHKNAVSRIILGLMLTKSFRKFMEQSLQNARMCIENGG